MNATITRANVRDKVVSIGEESIANISINNVTNSCCCNKESKHGEY